MIVQLNDRFDKPVSSKEDSMMEGISQMYKFFVRKQIKLF